MTYLASLIKRLHETQGPQLTNALWLLPTHALTPTLNKLWAQKRNQIDWALTTHTWQELLAKIHPLTIPHHFTLLKKLYPIAAKHLPLPSFARFIPLGRDILAEFDRLDQHLLDPKKTLQVPKEGTANPFWQNIKAQKNPSTERLFITWQALYPIYQAYREKLLSQDLAYLGLHYRQVVEKLNQSPPNHFPPIIGLQLHPLPPAAQAILKHLARITHVDLHYITDQHYMTSPHQEAGYHLRTYAKDPLLGKHLQPPYPQELSQRNQPITLLRSTTVVGQIIALKDELSSELEKNTHLSLDQIAIILPDPQLIVPLIETLAPQFPLNLHMGYPFVQTPLYAFLRNCIALQAHHPVTEKPLTTLLEEAINRLFQHPYLATAQESLPYIKQAWQGHIVPPDPLAHLHPLAKLLLPHQDIVTYFRHIHKTLQAHQKQEKTNPTLSKWEAIIWTYGMSLIERFTDLPSIQKEKISPSKQNQHHQIDQEAKAPHQQSQPTPTTHRLDYLRLFQREAASITMPMHGQPHGIHVFHFHQSIALEASHIFILSMNEGTLPRKSNTPTLLPAAWRQKAGFPTTQSQEAHTAYLFYNLVKQAKKLWISYHESTVEGQASEKSRYLWQLIYDTKFQIEEKSYAPPPTTYNTATSWTIPKSKTVLDALNRFRHDLKGKSDLTPSAINTYLDCPRCFYLQHIAQIPKEPMQDAKMHQARLLGIRFHAVMRALYTPYIGQTITAATLRTLHDSTPKTIKETLARLSCDRDTTLSTPIQKIEENILQRLVRQVVHCDQTYAPFTLLALEFGEKGQLTTTHTLPNGITLRLGGIIDRIDRKGNTVRLIDYKTGHWQPTIRHIDHLFLSNSPQRNPIALQLFWYSYLYHKKHLHENLQLAPTIFSPNQLFATKPIYHFSLSQGHNKSLTMLDIQPHLSTFQKALDQILLDIYNPTHHFAPPSQYHPKVFSRFPSLCHHPT